MLAIRFVFCTLSRRPSPVPKTRPVSAQEAPGDVDAHARMRLMIIPGFGFRTTSSARHKYGGH